MCLSGKTAHISGLVLLRSVKVRAQKDNGALYGILGIVPRFVFVSVIVLATEPADIPRKLLEIVLYNGACLLFKVGKIAFVELLFGFVEQQAVVGKAELGLCAVFFCKFLV